jgi:predicted amidohydrolase YtcJ
MIPTMMLSHFRWRLLAVAILASIGLPCCRSEAGAAEVADKPRADLIIHHGKIVTVDKHFTIYQAMAVLGGRILRVGSNEEVLQTQGPKTKLLDLNGKTVLPGLIDSHVHPTGACLTEFDHPIPEMESIQNVLDYVKARAKVSAEGEWITVDQVFITRLREQRYPTKEELDQAAPKNPVVFRTGPDAALNSLALKVSKIDKDFRVIDLGAGYAEKDPKTGEPTGILRNCTRYVLSQPTGRKPTDQQRMERLLALFKDYNSVGLTSIIDRDASGSAINQYRQLHDQGRLPLRLAVSQHIDTSGDIEQVQKNIRQVAQDPLCKGIPSPRPLPRGERTRGEGDAMLRIVGIKTYLDGGMLTGSAYMRQPWGVSKIYSITDPSYRGLLFIPPERLKPIVETTVESGLQFTAHSVGDGAVHTLLDVYEEVNHSTPIRKTRPCITHSNFMSREAVSKLASLGVAVDIQPAWLYLDTRTLVAQFGYDRLRYFQPLRSIFEAGAIAGGGSDHMQKIGSLRAINPYNPFLAMWTTITRKAKGYEGQLHPEEALSREQALRFYTINNAYLMFLEDQIGSLEPGKLADFVIVDTDLLTCPVDSIKETQVLQTYLGGKLVYERK